MEKAYGEKGMRIPERYRKRLTKRAWFNCLRLAVALFVIVWLFDFAHVIVFSEITSIWLKALFLICMAFFFSFVLWLSALISPELIEILFGILGFKEKEEKDNEDQT